MSEALADTKIILKGRKVVGGIAEGEAMVTREMISGWGGINPRDGSVIEMRHELRGQSFAGKILLFPERKARRDGRIIFIWRACAVLRPKQCCLRT